MDSDMEHRIQIVLDSIDEYGPEIEIANCVPTAYSAFDPRNSAAFDLCRNMLKSYPPNASLSAISALRILMPTIRNTRTEAEAIGERWKIPLETVITVKYLAEHGPIWDERIDTAWNVVFQFDPLNNPYEEADDTICPYDECDEGYESEFESHSENCPYKLAVELLNEWRQKLL